jgi:hypothetical protein
MIQNYFLKIHEQILNQIIQYKSDFLKFPSFLRLSVSIINMLYSIISHESILFFNNHDI